VAVWRQPCQLPTDFDIWEAVPLPDGMNLHRNSFFVSSDGWCITQLAGGDFDGDLLMASFSEKLINFLELTPAVNVKMAPNGAWIKELEGDLENALNNPSSPELLALINQAKELAYSKCTDESDEAKAKDFLKFSCNVETPQIRGATVAKFERCVYACLCNPWCWASNAVANCIKFGMLAHKTHDVPKKLLAILVRLLAVHWRKEFGVPARGTRSSEWFCETWLKPKLKIRGLNHLKVFRHVQPQLAMALPDYTRLGMVWVPEPEIFLGYDAGKAIGEYLLSHPRGVRAPERSSLRTPLMDLALLISHRLQGVPDWRSLGALLRTPLDVIKHVLKESHKRPIECLRSLKDSFLP